MQALGPTKSKFTGTRAFSTEGPTRAIKCQRAVSSTADSSLHVQRRHFLTGLWVSMLTTGSFPGLAIAQTDFEPMEALKGKDYGKPRMKYGDYQTTASGLQYTDLREGTGDQPQPGDLLIVDWDGYTIGYYGRPFEARNKPKGSSFTGENKEFLRFKFGDHSVIPAFEEAVATMKPGGIRRIIVPVELGYPDNDWRKQGPAPTTFAGQRALEFVLGNRGMIDKTLLFDIELIRVQH